MGDPETITLNSTADLRWARQRATERAIPFLGEERGGDVGVVVSELSTNGLEHGQRGEVRIHLGHAHDAFLVAVEADSDEVPVVVDDVPVHHPSGRGLHIVNSLVDELSIDLRGRRIEVLCRFDHARSA